MRKKYVVKLKPEGRTELLELTQNGKATAKTLPHALILLKADDQGHLGDADLHGAEYSTTRENEKPQTRMSAVIAEMAMVVFSHAKRVGCNMWEAYDCKT